MAQNKLHTSYAVVNSIRKKIICDQEVIHDHSSSEISMGVKIGKKIICDQEVIHDNSSSEISMGVKRARIMMKVQRAWEKMSDHTWRC
jgi:hypothetical protein